MRRYNVTGMSCAACSARVEKAVSKVEGVSACNVNLLTNSMGVEGDASDEDIINAVKAAGYGVSLQNNNSEGNNSVSDGEELKDTDTPIFRRRLVLSLVFLFALMYISMGHMMWNLPLPAWLHNNYISMGLLQMLLALAVMIINQHFFINGFKGLVHRAPNMDTLVALGSSASFGWSVYVLFLMSDAVVHGKNELAMDYMHDFYFEAAAMILALITLGKMLESRSKGKTTDALKGLMKLAPKKATLLVDGVETEVMIDQVKVGDIYVVKPGENVPVDGVVLEGESAVDESALTGESVPVDKSAGDRVYAATINRNGFIKCEASRVGADTSLSRIIKLVSDASASKAPIARIADRVSGVFVPVVIIIAIITTIIWIMAGREAGYALARGISVLVISCPCALGLATPVAIMVGNGVGAKNGILFKNSTALEQAGKADIIVLDKTGTITKGEPVVTDIVSVCGLSQEAFLKQAASLETKSEHPLAKAVIMEAKRQGITPEDVTGFKSLTGSGVTAYLNNKRIIAGNEKFIRSSVKIDAEYSGMLEELSEDGKTPILFADENELIGIIALADTLKEDSAPAIQELKKMGFEVVMLTGDNERTAKSIGNRAGVDHVIAGVLPEGKEDNIRKLKERGNVIMVGDGINDAPALTRADIGIAIGAGTDVAIDAADIVLMKNSLADVPAAIRLSRFTLRNIRENLFWAFIYNIIGIPVAAGVFTGIGITLTPMFGAAAMSLSSFCVVTNALRLNLCKIYERDMSEYSSGNIDKIENKSEYINVKGDKTMTKTMIIEGMMCGHCEARVKKVLEGIEGVERAEVSHENGNAVVTCTDSVSDEILKETVEGQDYKVISIQ